MRKKYCLFITLILLSTLNYADAVQDQVVELQKSEKILLDTIYDHRDYATELWNSVVKNPGASTNNDNINKALTTLKKAEDIGALLIEVQNQLILFYSKYEKNESNLSTAQMNQTITNRLLKELEQLKGEFLTLQKKLEQVESVITKQPGFKDEPGIEKWTSIPWISDKKFRAEIYDYYTGGANKFIHNKPVVLLFYNINQEPSQDQFLNIEDIFERHRNSINFYRVSSDNNKELIKVFQVTSLPTIYYLNMGGELKKHIGTKGYYDIEQMIENHMN